MRRKPGISATDRSRDLDLWGCARLHSGIIYRVIGDHAGQLVRALEAGGAIETARYRAGGACKGYRLARRYLGDRCVRVPCVDPRLRERLEREQERMQAVAEQARGRWLPIHHALDGEQRRLSIAPEADTILDALPDHTRLCQSVLVDRLRHREFPFSVSTTGRVFNGITGLKRELRTALRIGGERVGGVDIACCQPALLALAMTRGIPTNGPRGPETYKDTLPAVPLPAPFPSPLSLPLDAKRFQALVLNGCLYEHLMNLTGLDRNKVKRYFLRDFLAKRGHYPSIVEWAFRREFPSVYDFVRSVNRHDHAALIRLLQRLESWLVVERVAPLLVGRVPCVTLHDAIYSAETALDAVGAAFEQVFAETGCRLRLKREATYADAALLKGVGHSSRTYTGVCALFV